MTEDECWAVLGIGPTADKRAVKKAYAAALKKSPPDKDPAAFRYLREAYEAALEEAEYLYLYGESWDEDDDPNADEADSPTDAPDPLNAEMSEPLNEREPAEDTHNAAEQPPKDVGPPVPIHVAESPPYVPDEPDEPLTDESGERPLMTAWELRERFEELFYTPASWSRDDEMRKLLEDPALEFLDVRNELDELLLNFLIYRSDPRDEKDWEHWATIPTAVWTRLDALFDWSSRELAISELHGDVAATPIVDRLRGKRPEAIAAELLGNESDLWSVRDPETGAKKRWGFWRWVFVGWVLLVVIRLITSRF